MDSETLFITGAEEIGGSPRGVWLRGAWIWLKFEGGNSQSRDSEGGNSENRDSEGRDSEGRSGIPKTGTPKAGIPKIGIPKTRRFTAPSIQTPLRLPLKMVRSRRRNVALQLQWCIESGLQVYIVILFPDNGTALATQKRMNCSCRRFVPCFTFSLPLNILKLALDYICKSQANKSARVSAVFGKSEPPLWGRQKVVTPICSDFPVFLPICSDLRSLFSGIPRFVPIYFELFRLFRFVFKTNQNNLGGRFGPRKKYLAPPPQFPNSPQTPSCPLDPPPPGDPPIVELSIKNRPPAPQTPPPRSRKK